MVRVGPLTLVAAALSVVSLPAHADPQTSVGLTIGGVVRDVADGGVSGAFHLGARGDLLLLRSRNSDMAFGPYLDVATASFHDADLGGGLGWLIPVTEDFPLLLSAGGFARDGDGGQGWRPGVEGTLLVGPRSYNFHSWYGLGGGLFVQTRWVPQSPSTVDVVIGVQVDVEILALPFVFAWQSLTHAS
ncbi:MAG TPA: hypothetical protein VF765_16920 [Polyangiaceae bacterium]